MCCGEQRGAGGDKLHPEHRSLLQPRGAEHRRDRRGVHHRHPPRHDLPRHHCRPRPQGQCSEKDVVVSSTQSITQFSFLSVVTH